MCSDINSGALESKKIIYSKDVTSNESSMLKNYHEIPLGDNNYKSAPQQIELEMPILKEQNKELPQRRT